MSLTNKWYQILNILLVKKSASDEELRQMTNISSQTLKKNITLLNDQLKETAQIVHDKKIYELKIKNLDEFQSIMAGELKKDTDFNSSGKRMAFILKELIMSGNFLLIDDLSETLQVSRGTVNKDIKTIKNLIMDFGVSLQGVPNKGIQVIGDEFNLRLIILKYVYDFYSSDYPLEEKTEGWADKLAKHYKLDQSTLASLKKVIAISISRILRNKPVNEPIPYYNNFEFESLIMQDFMIYLEKEYELTLGKYDQDFISFPINTRTTAMVTDSVMTRYEADVREIFEDMMSEVRNNFITELNDNELFDALKYHLMFMLNRVIFHVELFDLFMDEVQMKYPFSYELSKVAISVVETKLLIPINEVEVSYLTIYFELVRNKHQHQTKSKKVAIVCSTGRGTATLIHRQLSEVLGSDINIVQYSETDYREEDMDDYLAIFSTLPLPDNGSKPVIQITNLFDNKTIIQEWKRIDEQRLLENDVVDFSFEVLDHRLDYLTNVELMIKNLIGTGHLSPDFLPLWQERERRQRTIFDQGIGFPHTINRHSDKIVFRIGVLKEEIIEENQYVKLIFLVGIPEHISSSVEKRLMDVYDLIFLIGQNKKIVEEISHLSNQQELLGFLGREGFI